MNDVAHPEVFDKMLTDYFLTQRGEIKKGNQLLSNLEEHFKNQTNPMNADQQELHERLGALYNKNCSDKSESPMMIPSSFPALLDLDIAINRRLYDNTSGFSKELREKQGIDLQIPEYFDSHDVRKPPHLYVEDKLAEIIEDLFVARKSLEKHFTRNELIAYDQTLQKYLTKDILLGKLKREINKDFNEMEQFSQVAYHNADNETSMKK